MGAILILIQFRNYTEQAGVFSIISSIFNFDFYFESRKARFFVGVLGRNGARVFYGILGLLLIIWGLLSILL